MNPGTFYKPRTVGEDTRLCATVEEAHKKWIKAAGTPGTINTDTRINTCMRNYKIDTGPSMDGCMQTDTRTCCTLPLLAQPAVGTN